MKRFFVIDADTEMHSVFVHELTREFTAEDGDRAIAYHRAASADSLICDSLSPRFYGKLDALLITADKLNNAAPITPEPAEVPCTQAL